MGKTGNATGIHLHYEIRLPSNAYDKTINPADYMKIKNSIGVYNSKNYEIKVKEKFKEGQIVKINVMFTGAERKNESLIQIGNKQLWVYNSCLNKEKTQANVIVAFVDKYKIMVEIDSTEDSNKQFWIEKENVIC